jgi:beta-lactamase class A
MKKIFLILSILTLSLFNFQSYASAASPSLDTIIKKYPSLQLGVYFQDLTTNTLLASNLPNIQFTGASTTKVLTAITVIKQIEAGRYRYDSMTSKYGYSVRTELKLMINQSNNEAWDVLNNLATWNSIIDEAKNLGMVGYNCNGNLISPQSDAAMLAKLYYGHVLNVSDTNYLLSLMQNTNEESLIRPALPANAVYFHKYGWLNNGKSNVLNDTAIVLYNKHTYILSIYTNSPNVPNYSNQKNAIQDITKYLFNISK